MAVKVLLASLLAAVLAIVIVTGQSEEITQICLGCICEASSGCNVTQGCTGDVCGPFHITWAYWSDSGKPTIAGQSINDTTAYANCANDAQCAARSLQGYMDKYKQDCNGDKKITCDDYMRIHYLGGFGCSNPLPPKYEEAYIKCRNSFQ